MSMHEVLPRLYLGSWTEARTAAAALGAGCRGAYLVNCTKDLDDLGSDAMRVAVDDNGDPDEVRMLGQLLPSVVRNIEAKLEAGKPVMVHCLAGRQRSAAVCAAVVMHRLGLTADEAVQHVRSAKHGCMLPDVNFGDALRQYESDRDLARRTKPAF